MKGMTLPRRYYTSDQVFSLERERLFHDRWFCVGRRERLSQPGDFILVDVVGESLIVTVDDQNRTRALHNVCRHRGTQLVTVSEGQLPGCRICCPYHRWTYGCDGSLVAAPNMDALEGFQRSDWPLEQAAVEEWEGFLLVNLSPSPEALEKSFAPFFEQLRPWRTGELRVAQREHYDVATNWKMIFENFNECYHCRSVHPGLNEMSPVASCANDFSAGPFLGGPMDLTDESMTVGGKRVAPVIRTLDAERSRRVYYYTLLPNMMFAMHPDFVVAWRLWPRGSDSTHIEAEWLCEPEVMGRPDLPFDPSPAIRFWDITNRQDWEICRRSRAGIESRAYRPGPWSPDESIPRAFDEEVLRILGDSPT